MWQKCRESNEIAKEMNRDDLTKYFTAALRNFTAHSVVIHELFPQVNYCKTLENFRENASLNESTIKQPFENCNFRKFRPKLRSPGLNMTFSIHIRDLASVEKSKMFAEV